MAVPRHEQRKGTFCPLPCPQYAVPLSAGGNDKGAHSVPPKGRLTPHWAAKGKGSLSFPSKLLLPPERGFCLPLAVDLEALVLRPHSPP